MVYYVYTNAPRIRGDELYHYGVKGMRWGVRRYQNKDGSLTPAGKRRSINQEARQYRKELYKEHNFTRKLAKEESENWKKGQLEEAGLKDNSLTDKQKKAIKIGAAVAGTALVAYGGYKLYKSGKLDGMIDKGSAKLNELMKTSGSIKTAEVNRVNVPRTEVNRVNVPSVPTKSSRLKVQDLSEGTELLKSMQKNRVNITRELNNNPWMSEDMDKLARNIENMKMINAKRKDTGVAFDESTLARMELAYLVRRQSELRR